MRSDRPAPLERGVGTVLAATALLVITMAIVVGVWATGWMGARQRAQLAADAAALAAVSARIEGRDPCAAASRLATRNGAALVSCDVLGDARDIVATVSVRAELTPQVPRAPRSLTARASAGTSQ